MYVSHTLHQHLIVCPRSLVPRTERTELSSLQPSSAASPARRSSPDCRCPSTYERRSAACRLLHMPVGTGPPAKIGRTTKQRQRTATAAPAVLHSRTVPIAAVHRSHCRCAPLPCRGLQATANRSKQGRCVTVRTTVQGCQPAASLLRTRNLPQSAGQIWGFFGKSLVQPISCAIIARAHETCALVRHPPVRHVCFAPLASAHARRTLSARCDHDPRRTNRPRQRVYRAAAAGARGNAGIAEHRCQHLLTRTTATGRTQPTARVHWSHLHAQSGASPPATQGGGPRTHAGENSR